MTPECWGFPQQKAPPQPGDKFANFLKLLFTSLYGFQFILGVLFVDHGFGPRF